jgi:hypothetical protein
VIATGVGTFLDGLFRLDCQGIDAGCSNDSWHSHAHKIESALTVGAAFLALIFLAIAFRRLAEWRASWLVMLGALPALLAANALFSPLGPGASTRAGSAVLFLAFAFVGWRLLESVEPKSSSQALPTQIEPQRELPSR